MHDSLGFNAVRHAICMLAWVFRVHSIRICVLAWVITLYDMCYMYAGLGFMLIAQEHFIYTGLGFAICMLARVFILNGYARFTCMPAWIFRIRSICICTLAWLFISWTCYMYIGLGFSVYMLCIYVFLQIYTHFIHVILHKFLYRQRFCLKVKYCNTCVYTLLLYTHPYATYIYTHTRSDTVH